MHYSLYDIFFFKIDKIFNKTRNMYYCISKYRLAQVEKETCFVNEIHVNHAPIGYSHRRSNILHKCPNPCPCHIYRCYITSSSSENIL